MGLMVQVIRDTFTHDDPTVETVPYERLSMFALVSLARNGDAGAIAFLKKQPLNVRPPGDKPKPKKRWERVEFADLHLRVAVANEEQAKYSPDQPRDYHGRFGSGEGDAPSEPVVHHDDVPTFLNRETDVEVTAAPVEEITKYALGRAAKLEEENAAGHYTGGNGLYPHAEEYANYAVVDQSRVDKESGNYSPPDTWQPGTLDAQSQAASAWQSSFTASEDMQIAADALLGYGDLPVEMNDQVQPQAAAGAREMLTMMSGNIADGAAGAFFMGVNPDAPEGALFTQDFSKGTLARGVSDSDGSLRDAFQHSLDTGEPVAWSMASFVVGGQLGDDRIEYMQSEMGDEPPSFEDPETGEQQVMNGSQNAAATALQYTKPSESHFGGGPEDSIAPVLILGEGNALVVDGSFEAVMGGKFAVTDVHTASPMERMVWNADKSVGQQPLTVVRIRQTENVQLPPGVSTRP